MAKTPSHIKWLIDTGIRLETAEGKDIEVWELRHKTNNPLLSEWAAHFRNQYCSDTQIDILREGTGMSRTEYLTNIKFPDKSTAPGPSIRSGDFGEILIADYLEFICNYWIPRSRYDDRTIRNESDKGSDIIGFKIMNSEEFSQNDEMMIFEVKAIFSDTIENRLQDAVNDSNKDEVRKGESLNAIKQRYLDKDKMENVKKIARFQNILDNPFIEKSGAAAVLEKSVFDKTKFEDTKTSFHYNHNSLSLIVIRGENMMPLVHELYKRAADEA
jgi:hypothetical protein